MVTIFNRKELFGTFDVKKQAEVRNILSNNQIEYDIKVINRTSPSSIPVRSGTRAQVGTLGQQMKNAYEYIVYVKKCDYKKALFIIRNLQKQTP